MSGARHKEGAGDLNGVHIRQITAIENELGTRLFSRVNNVVSLTKAGQALYGRLAGHFQGLVWHKNSHNPIPEEPVDFIRTQQER